MERKLAAILAADVVGYSALMERDEKGTFARLKAHRTKLLEPEIKKHHGRVFKLMGDGLLAEFGSVVDAVECAVAVQKEMAKRNDGAGPDERIDLRIGVNLGDVIVEGEDFTARVSTSPPDWKRSPSPAGSVSLPRSTTRCAESSTARSRTWASNR